MKDLQAIITEKAEKELKAEITDFINSFSNHPFFNAIKDESVFISKDKRESFHSFFWYTSTSECHKKIFNANKDEYVARKSKEFVEKVDELRADLDELMEQ